MAVRLLLLSLLSFLLVSKAKSLSLRHTIHQDESKFLLNRFNTPLHKPTFVSSSKKEEDDPLKNYTLSIEVARPVPITENEKPCRILLMNNHHFANDPPPFTTLYTPPEECGKEWSKIILIWEASVRGRQFDRIASVAFGGLEVLRTSTQEPSINGVKWSVQKDISKYSSFLSEPQLLVVSLCNYVEGIYTGIYNVSLSLAFYGGVPSKFDERPHLILPVSGNPAGFSAFTLDFDNPSANVTFSNLPTNACRAEIEIYASHHGADEFYWSNPPDSYVSSLPSSMQASTYGGGVFREIQIYIDSHLAGTVWNYPLIYTGGINPYFWRPIVGIGAFDCPSYTVNIDPFLSFLMDGKNHTVRMEVKGIIDGGDWFVSGGLHVWLDANVEKTVGALTQYDVKPVITPTEIVQLYPNQIDANITTHAIREDVISGYIISSFGNITTTVRRMHNLFNMNRILSYGNTLDSYHAVHSEYYVEKKDNNNNLIIYSSFEKYVFPSSVYFEYNEYKDGSYSLGGNYNHAFNFEKLKTFENYKNVHTYQINSQNGTGYYASNDGNGNSIGYGSCDQKFIFKNYKNDKVFNKNVNSGDCFYRSVKEINYTFIYDDVLFDCHSIDLALDVHLDDM